MYLDIILGVMILFFIISGIRLGFFVEFISIFGLVGNFFVTGYLTPIVVDYIRKYYPSTTYTRGYIVIFIGLYLLLMLLTNYINLIFKFRDKSIPTRVTGGILSCAKGLILCLILLSIYNVGETIYPALKNYSKDSYAMKYYYKIEDKILDYIPNVLKEKIELLRDEKKLDKYLEKIM